VAIHAILWRGLIEQDRLALNLALQGVAQRAADIHVAARQGELSALIVIKRGWNPSLIQVAVSALRDSVLRGKLGAMCIRVAGLTIFRCSLELNFVGTREGLVTFAASDAAMRPEQRKFCFRMIEAANVDPGLGAVARFAAQRGSVGTLLRHAILEFALMGIHVAGCARAVRKMKRQNLVRPSPEAGFVTICAGDGYVGARQNEERVLVLRDREC